PNTPLPAPTVALTATEIPPTPAPQVTITSVKGNLYIRRGPGLEYNPIAVLNKDTSAEVIASDVLSNWVQVLIPNSEKTGWVSIQTGYSNIDGDLSILPDFTFTDWPAPAYVKNCTEHDMFITPGDIYLPNLRTNAEYKNEVQVNPGNYSAFDLFLPGEPEAQKFEIREGVTAHITINGLGVTHKCP
ncbi:MAG: SH3 domain-containing protein, partial [Gallionella sp.]|nr:SH3 domain-containing protein [Gallionella sp.]